MNRNQNQTQNLNQNQNIVTLAQYGNIMIPSKELANIRGSGSFNPPPRWEQSTDRGNAYQNAFAISGQTVPEPVDVNNIGLIHLNTPSGISDDLRKRVYQVGSTGLLEQPVGSWNRSEFEGADSQYVVWALKALQMTPTPLITFFFSKENVAYLQMRNVQEIKKHTNHNINEQSIDQLLIIMRNMILYAYSGWLPSGNPPNKITDRGEKPCSLEDRIFRLNKSVIEETVKQTLSGINMYKQYIKDQSSLPLPLSHPTYTSMSGSRELSENLGFSSGHDRTLAAQSYNQRYNIL